MQNSNRIKTPQLVGGNQYIGNDQSAMLPALKPLMDASGYMLLILAVISNGEIYRVLSIKKISTNLSPKPIGMLW